MKYTKLNQWLWRWHVIAGLISLPFVLVLAITGGIYLFKDQVEKPILNSIKTVEANGNPISYQEQLTIATEAFGKKPNSVIVPAQQNQATEFVTGKFSHKKSAFINPFSGKVSGKFQAKDTWMFTIRKLHGELLGRKVGTKVIELIASWMIVLILTGIYVFWPAREQGWKGFFRIRTKLGKRIFFRDIHAIGGFWISTLLVLVLAGGLPWTDVFGSSFKELQKITNTGFPKEWFGVGIKSQIATTPLSVDKMITIAQNQNLEGTVTLDFPKHKAGIFSVSNANFPLHKQQKIHFDQYSGKKLMTLNWSDVGFLMRGRMWVMAFHQGQFGNWNFYLMLLVSIGLTFMSLAGGLSFFLRSWGIPTVPKDFKVGYGILTFLIILGVILPLFGLSLILIFAGSYFKSSFS